jgi:hypothetical protein
MKTPPIQQNWPYSRLPFIATWRTFNSSLDCVFYNVGALSDQERMELSSHVSPLGEIVIVHPRRANKGLEHFTSLEFVDKQRVAPQDTISTLVVAGVGSSALGTACLARDVADYLGKPVAGIVSGLGVADVMAEALGGWFIFGAANALRDGLARTLQSAGFEDHVRHQRSHEAIKKHFEQQGLDPEWFIYGNPASTTLLFALSMLGTKIKLLVGHSKGNYCIENALEGLRQISARAGRMPFPAHLQIVTLGAVIWFDAHISRLHQFLGQFDALGMLNSRPDLDFVMVPGAWHSLNGMLPGHLAVAKALKLAGIPSGKARRVSVAKRTGARNGRDIKFIITRGSFGESGPSNSTALPWPQPIRRKAGDLITAPLGARRESSALPSPSLG